MESARVSILVSFLLLGLASPAISRTLGEFNEEKNFIFYPAPPFAGGSTPSTGTGGGHSTPSTPSYGSGDPHSTPSTPSYGSGGGHSTPSVPSYGTGGGHSTPSTPSYGTTPTTPSYGGHGSPTPTYGSTPTTPTTPTYGSGSGHATPSTPSYGSGGGHASPTPTIPSIDPHHLITGTCDYWRSHPQQIYTIVGYITNIGNTFGPTCGVLFGPTTSLHDALSNPRTDGYGALIREGTASFLNSCSNSHFPFTSDQVRDAVIGSLSTMGAAAAQADIFRQANEGHYHV
ncbi:hypothetical protein LUZ60_012441 [Juncus effusus]|nr:hypothetical protein LUZ60_012441 [Juncus effusus]